MTDEKDFSRVQQLEISADRADQRLDNYLIQYFKHLPKSRVYRLIRKGEVRVNRGRVGASYRLRLGDCLRIPPVKNLEVQANKVIPESLKALLLSRIIYADADLLVLDKPPGIAVHGGSELAYGVIDILRAISPTQAEWQLVHRLDKGTSGCLLIAKSLKVLRALQAAFQANQVEKIYQAILVGAWQKPKQLIVDAPLARNQLASGERFVCLDETGKSAESVFTLIRATSQHSLVEVALKTGRTHQIRVHAQSIGQPILGDDKYGSRQANKLASQLGIKQICLQASRLRFIHPVRGEPIVCQIPFDTEMLTTLNLNSS